MLEIVRMRMPIQVQLKTKTNRIKFIMVFLNVHASLLPSYRGAAPINWAIINGEKETGITIMKLEMGESLI